MPRARILCLYGALFGAAVGVGSFVGFVDNLAGGVPLGELVVLALVAIVVAVGWRTSSGRPTR